MLRHHEIDCRDAIVNFFVQSGFSVQIEDEDHDPPDCWLTLNGRIFAFELTTLVESTEGGKHRTTIESSFGELAQDVEDTAIERGILRGFYNIVYPPIEDMKRFGRKKGLIKEAFLHFIEWHRCYGSKEQTIIFQNDDVVIWAEKVNDTLLGVSDRPCYFSFDVPETLRKMLDEKLKYKAKRLKAENEKRTWWGKDEKPRVILGLLHGFPLARIPQYADVIGACEEFGFFDGIYLVDGQGSVTPLRGLQIPSGDGA